MTLPTREATRAPVFRADGRVRDNNSARIALTKPFLDSASFKRLTLRAARGDERRPEQMSTPRRAPLDEGAPT
ncbi:hypothetical protein [Streptomyces sp. NPDC005525]|uniref:hypothetical protein n=1 Tax=Streptomyces sp. NPDC005525 TaxID=3364720 RepID=UPI0036973DF4